ncbi:hypothetical protein Dtox_1381 [Desulfofarcimen acetoxidans DSM 771]|uniref:Uncharacterized protein n=1 Tax=Desulfofarcimen acetoxidans (strain ATCC 49208 / DSM 771 / KCTC 5769 / VKM B-1644 / 5575) TaxID=485916 RepID=C8W6G8_DESAS|nr:hypothetical protein [Desulfofarcimen acetoxidans]ACV62257.1 hypothetical protein Dtox_1381 [Desulfofarcimen acetoxidans DSM 771]
MPSDDEQEQLTKRKDEPTNNREEIKSSEHKKSLIFKVKPVVLLLIIICLTMLLAGILITNNPKYKYIKTISDKPLAIDQAEIFGHMDIEKYNLNLAASYIKGKYMMKAPDISGTKIFYNGKLSFKPRKMTVDLSIDYLHHRYRLKAYLTGDQLILNTLGFLELYQVIVPEKQKPKLPEYIYTDEETKDYIHILWNRLENTFNNPNKTGQQAAVEQLTEFILKSVPQKYFSQDSEGWFSLSFTQPGLKEISLSLVEKVWNNSRTFAGLISQTTFDGNSMENKRIEKEIIEVISNNNLSDVKTNINQAWLSFNQVINLNKFSLSIKNNPPEYNTILDFDCGIEKSPVFPNGGSIIFKGASTTVVKKLDISLPDINEQNSINIKDIKL